MHREGFTTPDDVQKKRAIFIVFYEDWNHMTLVLLHEFADKASCHGQK
jgi:hypothetical protein